MALFGHGPMSDLSPLSGVERKSDLGAVRSEFDPQRTLAACATNYARIRFLTRAREAIRSRCAALRLPPCLASGYTIAAAILR
jgi:hypothetical protein